MPLVVTALLTGVVALSGCSASGAGAPGAAPEGGSTTGPSLTFATPKASTKAASPTVAPTPKSSTDAKSSNGSAKSKHSKATPSGKATANSGGGAEVPNQVFTVTGQVTAPHKGLASVRTASGKTTVAWDGGTAFLDTRSAKRSDVRKGVCVVASTAIAAPGAQRTGPGGAAEVVWVLVSAPIDRQCPKVAPQAPGASGAARMMSGLVTKVKGPVVTLETEGVGVPTAQIRVALADKAQVVRTVDSSAGSVRKGRCVVVVGTHDAKGRLVASSVTVSDPGKSGCTL
ncbi:hypothetical protein [Intrasporangium sp.]|uniref:hypothetical protein n=1 Tax=Intrasporangium sp. TaxID=1925024 RepID=UPI00322155F3